MEYFPGIDLLAPETLFSPYDMGVGFRILFPVCLILDRDIFTAYDEGFPVADPGNSLTAEKFNSGVLR